LLILFRLPVIDYTAIGMQDSHQLKKKKHPGIFV